MALRHGDGFWGSVLYAVGVAVYKLAEHWALSWVEKTFLEDHTSRAVRFLLDSLPIVTWLLAALGLVWIGQRLARGSQPSVATTILSATAPSTTSPTLIPTKQLNVPVLVPERGFEFYPGRDTLPPERQLRAHIESAKDQVWALWNTGTEAFQAKMLETGRIKKLLLPHPDEVASLLAAAEGSSPENGLRDRQS